MSVVVIRYTSLLISSCSQGRLRASILVSLNSMLGAGPGAVKAKSIERTNQLQLALSICEEPDAICAAPIMKHSL